MPFLRLMPRASLLRSAAAPTRTLAAGHRFASDYGSGTQYDGKNPSEHIEHPGPDKPSAAKQGNGSSGESSSQQKSTSSQQTGGSETQQQRADAEAKGTAGEKDTKGAQPKILNSSPPEGGEQSQEVADHNADMGKRADQAHEKGDEKDKVGKGFWRGQGGVDKDP